MRTSTPSTLKFLCVVTCLAIMCGLSGPLGIVAGGEVPTSEERGPSAPVTRPAPAPEKKPSIFSGADAMEALFLDDSSLKIKLLETQIELVTPYGKLTIPVSHVRQVELATRLTDEETRSVVHAIGGLEDEDYARREEATAALIELGEKAYPELLKVSKSSNAEAARRAKQIIDKLREEVSDERLAASGFDLVHTTHSRIAGNLTARTFRVATQQFGELELKLADVRELRSSELAEAEPTDVLADPGNLTSYQAQVGKTFHFRVTGATQMAGSLYGTGTYTVDGNLSLAAVHAGALKPGETKVIKVKIVGPTPSFTGSTQNGFTSSSYSSYNGYEIVLPKRRR